MLIRELTNEDTSILEGYLQEYCESSMFLLSNMQTSGLEYEDAAYHGNYLAAIDNNNLIKGVLIQYWNGNVMMQSPDIQILQQLISTFKSIKRRPVSGVLGEDRQAEFTITHLGLSDADYLTNRSECLYALELSHLVMPPIQHQNDVNVVEAGEIPGSLLLKWIKAYNIEALGYEKGELLESRSRALCERVKKDAGCWVLLYKQQPVSLSAFNARIENMVQIGPVWTPPGFRNNGFARILLSRTLKQAFAQGIEKAILFTNEPSAEKAYKAIGFKPVGNFRLAILSQPESVAGMSAP